MSKGEQYVTVGRITGVFGVRGWVKVQSYTSPRDNLLNYRPWLVAHLGGLHERVLLAGQSHRKGLVALLDGCTDPTTALPLVGCEVVVRREVLPPPEDGEYYWADLIGLRVFTLQGVDLGQVDSLIETGANDVLVVRGERERLVPYLSGSVIREVDLAGSRLVVDWDPEF
ncbi:Ribosome maturation factor RimM [Gammaproteobacteria bacterium]